MNAWFLPESPKFLISVKRFTEARYILNKIAKLNRATHLDPKRDLIREELIHNKRTVKKKQAKEQYAKEI